ncbi:MAG: hypothetical protein WC700_10200 [Gemmatimonadaceae bacterium]|jgi:hypothetical protein
MAWFLSGLQPGMKRYGGNSLPDHSNTGATLMFSTRITPENFSKAFLVTKYEVCFPAEIEDWEIDILLIDIGYIWVASRYSRILSSITNRDGWVSSSNQTKQAMDETNKLLKDAIQAHNSVFSSAVRFGFTIERAKELAATSAKATFAPAKCFAKRSIDH